MRGAPILSDSGPLVLQILGMKAGLVQASAGVELSEASQE